jgi:capsular exopolysaccharide synthesis family protein
LRAELAKVIEAVKNDYLAAEAQEQSLVRALDAQKRDVLDLNRKSVEYGALQRQAASDREIYERLLTQTQTRGVTGKTADTNIQIVESAELPRSPVGPKRNQQLALTLFGGLLLALSAPLVRESLDNRVKSPADLERQVKLRCLAMVPIVPSDPLGKGPLLTSDASAFNEAFRRVRTTIRLGSSESGTTRLLVTSAGPREGKSLIATNLAMALAQMNQRVLLIDGDLRRPKVHKMLGLPPFPGLADVLNGEAAVGDAIRQTTTPNLFVLPCGLKRRGSPELLSSSKFQHLVEDFDDSFDWIVFDTPPTGPVADACVIGQWVHHAILVVSADSTPMAAARATIEQLQAARIPIVGAILNRVDLEHSGYYYAPYYQGDYADYYAIPATARHRQTGKLDESLVETVSN